MRAARLHVRWSLPALLALGATLTAPHAIGDDRDEARSLLKEGNTYLSEGRYVEALERFRAAHAKYPSAKLLLNIGTSLRQLGRYAEAIEAYEQFLDAEKEDTQTRDEVKKLLAEMSNKVATVKVRVSEPAERITIDGKPVAERSASIDQRLDVGAHVIVAERAGGQTAVERVDLRAGEVRDVALAFGSEAKPPPSSAAAPTTAAPQVDRAPVAETSGSAQRTWGWVALGVGAVGVATGAITGAMVASKKSDLENQGCTEDRCPSSFADDVDTYNRLRTFSTIGFAVGAVGLAAGTILIVTAPSSSTGARLELRIGVNGAAIRGQL